MPRERLGLAVSVVQHPVGLPAACGTAEQDLIDLGRLGLRQLLFRVQDPFVVEAFE